MSHTVRPSHPPRLRSLDIARGLIMVLMAIDHVRVFAGVPAGGATAALFFTRWITHFCAPGFVFFAGTAAYLHGTALGDRAALSRFLAVRGLWLVLLELTFMRWAWTFNADLVNYNLAGVLWMLGWCMVALAAIVWLPLGAVGALGGLVVFGHNLVDPYLRSLTQALANDPWRGLWQVLYFGGAFRLGESGPRLVVLYSLLPWVGVMAAGYAFGRVMRWPDASRRRACLAGGAGAVALFLLLRAFNLYGDPRPWGPPTTTTALPAVLSFLNTTKYPASCLFLLMTLGPLMAALPVLERARGRIVHALEVFGRVPLFYYILHIPLIHVAAIGISLLRTGAVTPWLFANHPMEPPPPPAGYMWSLPMLYTVTYAVVFLLYFACRWFAGLKRRSPARWLRLV